MPLRTGGYAGESALDQRLSIGLFMYSHVHWMSPSRPKLVARAIAQPAARRAEVAVTHAPEAPREEREMSFMSSEERAFSRAISELALANPFLPERVAGEKKGPGRILRRGRTGLARATGAARQQSKRPANPPSGSRCSSAGSVSA
jgi:hypothetical protein